jgi:hypothetical protein
MFRPKFCIHTILEYDVQAISFSERRVRSEVPKKLSILFILFMVFGLLGIGEKGFAQYLYKWVDEKGTVHFSEDPPAETSVNEEKKPPTENTAKILKKLEFGKREIPEDMRKYGPGGGGISQSSGGQSGGSSSQSSRSTPVRRS